MPVRIAVLFGLFAALGGVFGCLRAFGPDLRVRGAHAALAPSDADTQCMDCHESEADALVRMQGGAAPDTHAHAGQPHQHGDGPAHTHAEPPAPAPAPTPTSPAMAMDGPPLVADWMLADARACTTCHRIRP